MSRISIKKKMYILMSNVKQFTLNLVSSLKWGVFYMMMMYLGQRWWILAVLALCFCVKVLNVAVAEEYVWMCTWSLLWAVHLGGWDYRPQAHALYFLRSNAVGFLYSELCTDINQTKTNPEMKPPPLWPFTWKGNIIKALMKPRKKDPIRF